MLKCSGFPKLYCFILCKTSFWFWHHWLLSSLPSLTTVFLSQNPFTFLFFPPTYPSMFHKTECPTEEEYMFLLLRSLMGGIFNKPSLHTQVKKRPICLYATQMMGGWSLVVLNQPLLVDLSVFCSLQRFLVWEEWCKQISSCHLDKGRKFMD